MKSFAKKAVFLMALLLFCYGAQAQNQYNVYQADSSFVMQYPLEWTIVPGLQENDRLRLVKNNMPYTDFVINMFYSDGFKNVTTKAAMAQFDPQVFLRNMRNSAPDVRLVDNGKTFLSNHEAAYLVYEYRLKSLGIEVPVKQLVIITVKNSYMYMLAFRTSADQYNNMLPTFQTMAGGFSFK